MKYLTVLSIAVCLGSLLWLNVIYLPHNSTYNIRSLNVLSIKNHYHYCTMQLCTSLEIINVTKITFTIFHKLEEGSISLGAFAVSELDVVFLGYQPC